MNFRVAYALLAIITAGCASAASGPKFNAAVQPILSPDRARIYVMRDSVTYLAQAPSVVSAQIFIDGQPIGLLKNGGFLMADVVAGQHTVVAASSDQTARTITVKSGAVAYIAIWDRTRMTVPLVSEISAPVSERDGHVWGVGTYSSETAKNILPTLAYAE